MQSPSCTLRACVKPSQDTQDANLVCELVSRVGVAPEQQGHGCLRPAHATRLPAASILAIGTRAHDARCRPQETAHVVHESPMRLNQAQGKIPRVRDAPPRRRFPCTAGARSKRAWPRMNADTCHSRSRFAVCQRTSDDGQCAAPPTCVPGLRVTLAVRADELACPVGPGPPYNVPMARSRRSRARMAS